MPAYYNEFDRTKAAWLRELISRGLIAPGEVDERSIADVRPADLAGFDQCHFFAGIGAWSLALRLAGWPDDRPVWTGSCPCQPFSGAGKQEGKADARHLWPVWFPLIAERRPHVVFGEQVSSPVALSWLDDVRTQMESADYALGALDTSAAFVGSPQIRQRLYWVADRDGAGLGFESEPHGEAEPGGGGVQPGLHSDGCDFALRVGNLHDPRPQRRGIRWDGPGECSLGAPGVAGPVNGFWHGADWVLTRPERMGDPPRLRPIEPGSFPLVTGAPARVGRLRGYGDAICVPLAVEFIKAFLETKEGAA